MSSNTPTLTSLEEKNAPWNEPGERTITINVLVSLSLSKTMSIQVEIPDNLSEEEEDEYIKDYINLEETTREQCYLPDEAFDYVHKPVVRNDLQGWNVDEFTVIQD